jgi:hypothetical protein
LCLTYIQKESEKGLWHSGILGGLAHLARSACQSELVSFGCGEYHFLW